ncbi:antitoxin VapB [Roseiarcus fermentans]|uniref:Antitoxin VapB n=1 Tax=Roseiarcus fermentans TaxID=1473586 RepID=A0A366FTQ3_9HYPH|nr:hypothetical protein [Roseiarcus fermentans]RBP18064.1 antitoxin VapB [Roseiarcus fermentans]
MPRIPKSVIAGEEQALRKPTSAGAGSQAAAETATQRPPLSERLREAIAIAQRIGPFDPDFDLKRFSDEMWDF